MQLLTPDEVKTEKTRSEEERAVRIEKLKSEELALIQRVNEKHEIVDSKIAQLNDQLKAHRQVVETQIFTLDSEIAVLKKEVEALESRKIEALKPIDEIREKAEKLLQESRLAESAIANGERDLAQGWTDLSERVEEVTDKESIVTEKSTQLDYREKKIAESEDRTRKSVNMLADSWLNFHREVHKANEEIAKREKSLSDREKSVNTYAVELSKKETELIQKERRLADAYGTLERSKKEILEGKRDVDRIK